MLIRLSNLACRPEVLHGSGWRRETEAEEKNEGGEAGGWEGRMWLLLYLEGNGIHLRGIRMAGMDRGMDGGMDGGMDRGTWVVFSHVAWRCGAWTDTARQKWCQLGRVLLPDDDGPETQSLRLMCTRAVTNCSP